MKATKAKTEVEGIYPLSFLQQALLFHSLQETEDQGFLQVECVIRGKLDVKKFKDAWKKLIQRHETLRTSIHWENIEKPVQVIHKNADLPFEFNDWSELNNKEQKEKIKFLKNADKQNKLNLSSSPVMRIALTKIDEGSYFLLWSCHHILADGWSASTILQDLLTYYEDLIEERETTNLEPIPSYKSYLKTVKEQDLKQAKKFWQDALESFENPNLNGDIIQTEKELINNYSSRLISLSKEDSQNLKDFARKNHITLNTLIHGIWGFLLSRYLETQDVVFGTTVSGRSMDLPNAELLAGMFMNVLPVRVRIKPELSFVDWLKSIQEFLANVRNYEHLSLDKILEWNNLRGKDSLFNNLIVFENIPLNISGGGISIENFKSGLTSTYPLTLAVLPDNQIEFFIKYNESLFSVEEIDWFYKNLISLIKAIDLESEQSVENLLSNISPKVFQNSKKNKKASEVSVNTIIEKGYYSPKNNVELELVKIWENLLGISPISTTDNFFGLGGRSIIAVRMFAQIAEKLDRNLPPTTLLKSPTIKSLASVIKEKTTEDGWSSLVPIRASGTKIPIFCMHAGGGHVLYYKTLSDYLDTNQPVYGIQPLGLDGLSSPQENVEEMAKHYLSEIEKIYPKGPYYFVGYCFSNAVCIEMAKQLYQKGEKDFKVIIVDSHPMFMSFDKNLFPTFGEKLQSYRILFRQNNWKEMIQRSAYKVRSVKDRFKDLINTKTLDEQEQNLQNTQNAIKSAYQNYEWKPFDFEVTLMLAGNFKTHPWGKTVIAQWETLTNQVEYLFVKGSHTSLFDEPDVQELAKVLQKYLDENVKKNVVKTAE